MSQPELKEVKERLKQHLLKRFLSEIPEDNQIERVKVGSWDTVIQLLLDYREIGINGRFSSGTSFFASTADKKARENAINLLNARHAALEEAWAEELGEYWYSHLHPD